MIKEGKQRVREMLRENGYRKITLQEDKRDTPKTYFLYDGEIHIRVNDSITFHFGEDKLMGCSAHICADGYDLGTHCQIAEEIFKKLLTGEASEAEVRDYVQKVLY